MTDVVVERDGRTLLIWVNRPAKRNAWNLSVIEKVAQAYQELEDDPELWVGVMHGVGEHFSAGLDLAEVGPRVAKVGPQALAGSKTVDPFGLWAPAVSKPIVMAVQGIAYTLSIELALASDIVVAAVGRPVLPA